jgi:predicted DNA-binding transcriptional regulator AlpA
MNHHATFFASGCDMMMSETNQRKTKNRLARNNLDRQGYFLGGDDTLVSIQDASTVLSMSTSTLSKFKNRQRLGVPEPKKIGKCVRWRLGDLRAWVRGVVDQPEPVEPRRLGRPTKREQLARAATTPTSQQ